MWNSLLVVLCVLLVRVEFLARPAVYSGGCMWNSLLVVLYILLVRVEFLARHAVYNGERECVWNSEALLVVLQLTKPLC